jgi:hypothetical protein
LPNKNTGMKKNIIAFIFLIACCSLQAQDKVAFSTQNYVGLLVGSNGSNPQIQTINGIRFKKWFTGIGTGIDWYYQRSIPVFLSVERGFRVAPKKNIYFSSGAGINFPWRDNAYNDWNWGSVSETKNGLFWNAGFGYKISVSKTNDAILLYFGYSNKVYSEKIKTTYPCLVGPCPENIETYKYNLQALSVKVGYGF